jgi:excisionase family DNA binding protein
MRDSRLTLTVPEAGALLGLGRGSAYAAAKRGDLPTITIGCRKLLVPKATLYAMLGVAPESIPVGASTNGAADS